MKPRKSAAHFAKMLFALLLFCSALALLVNGILTPGIAQSKEEREVEDKIPKHDTQACPYKDQAKDREGKGV